MVKDDGLDPRFWGYPPTRWRVFTSTMRFRLYLLWRKFF